MSVETVQQKTEKKEESSKNRKVEINMPMSMAAAGFDPSVREVSLSDLRAQKIKIARMHHPDANGGKGDLDRIQQANDAIDKIKAKIEANLSEPVASERKTEAKKPETQSKASANSDQTKKEYTRRTGTNEYTYSTSRSEYYKSREQEMNQRYGRKENKKNNPTINLEDILNNYMNKRVPNYTSYKEQRQKETIKNEAPTSEPRTPEISVSEKELLTHRILEIKGFNSDKKSFNYRYDFNNLKTKSLKELLNLEQVYKQAHKALEARGFNTDKQSFNYRYDFDRLSQIGVEQLKQLEQIYTQTHGVVREMGLKNPSSFSYRYEFDRTAQKKLDELLANSKFQS
jgi:hypothetical protein